MVCKLCIKKLKHVPKPIQKFNNFLVYKASGGLTHMCSTLSSAIYCAKKYNRYLIIDTKAHSAFGNVFSNFFTINDKSLKYSCDYKVIPDKYKFHNISIGELENISSSLNNGKYFLKNTNININKTSNLLSPIDVISPSSTSYMNINNNIKVIRQVKDKLKEKRLNKKYISVHFRNTDIKNNINDLITKLKIAIKKYGIKTVYLATDDYSAYDKLEKQLPNIEIIQYTKPGNFGGKNIHYSTQNKYEQVYNCLLDIYIILNSNVFIPCVSSGLSKWIIKMIRNNKNIFDIPSKTLIL